MGVVEGSCRCARWHQIRDWSIGDNAQTGGCRVTSIPLHAAGELLAGCLGAVAGAVVVIEVPHLVRSGLGLESLPSSGLVLDALTIAVMVGVPFPAVGGLTLALVRARVDRGSEKPTR